MIVEKVIIPIYSFLAFDNIYLGAASPRGRVMRSKDAWDRAAECAAEIKVTTDPTRRRFLIHMRDSWIEIADHLTAVEDGVAATATTTPTPTDGAGKRSS